jgi:hypothetical protein
MVLDGQHLDTENIYVISLAGFHTFRIYNASF